MTDFACWGTRGLLGSNLCTSLNAKNFDELNSFQDFSGVVLNCRESSSKRLADQNVTEFLDKTASKSIELYKSISFSNSKLIYFSTINNSNDIYSQMKRWLEDLPEKFLEKSNFKVVRLPGILGKNLRKGPLFDCLAGTLYDDLDTSIHLMDINAIVDFIKILVTLWEKFPSIINLTPTKRLTIGDIWHSIHVNCSCKPTIISTDKSNLKLVQSERNFSDKLYKTQASQQYLNRFINENNILCNKS